MGNETFERLTLNIPSNWVLQSELGSELIKWDTPTRLDLTFTLSDLFDEIRVAKQLDGGETLLHALIHIPR